MRKILVDIDFIGQDLMSIYYYRINYIQVEWISVKSITRALDSHIYTTDICGIDFIDACKQNGIEILTTNGEV